MSEKTPDEAQVQFSVRGSFGIGNAFGREAPASNEGPPEAWSFARNVIDHGCFVLETVNQLRSGRQTRDSVTASLLRRALITAEGVWQTLAHGLEEPAAELTRTLLEIQVNLKLVVQDETNRMASRLAAFHYLAGQRYGTSILGDSTVRAKISAQPEGLDWTKAKAREFKSFFESPAFDEVRDEVARHQHWHGFSSVEKAFEAAGSIDEYRRLYILYSPFVHANNVDFDFAGIEDGSPVLKALVQRNPTRTLSQLGGMVLLLLEIVELFVEDRENAGYPRSVEVRMGEDSDPEMVSQLVLLQFQASAIYGPWLGVDSPPVVTED